MVWCCWPVLWDHYGTTCVNWIWLVWFVRTNYNSLYGSSLQKTTFFINVQNGLWRTQSLCQIKTWSLCDKYWVLMKFETPLIQGFRQEWHDASMRWALSAHSICTPCEGNCLSCGPFGSIGIYTQWLPQIHGYRMTCGSWYMELAKCTHSTKMQCIIYIFHISCDLFRTFHLSYT